MHLGRSHTTISSAFTSPSPTQTQDPVHSAYSPSENLSSLSSTHPINGDPQAQRQHDIAKGIPTSPPPRSTRRNTSSTTANQKAAALAKQEIRSKLREDWSWPPSINSPCSHQTSNLPTEESAWHERGYGFDSASDHEEVDPYQFDTPDSVAPTTPESRKRKRQRLLEEEISYNEGLRQYVERRDAWSGARRVPAPHSADEPATEKEVEEDEEEEEEEPHLSHQAMPGFDGPFPNLQAKKPRRATTTTTTITQIPLAPPILSTENPVRAAITAATYPSIYSKIVIQGLSPTVPINLSDVVGALVQGWKENDEWPPKSEEERARAGEGVDGVEGAEMGAVGVREFIGGKRAVRRGMGRVRRVLGLGNGEVEEDVRGDEVGNEITAFEGRGD